MHAIADTIKLVDDGVISKGQATTIEQRARESMMVLAINMLLGGGILAASGGLIFWLADALYVALCGSLALVIGVVILMRNSSVFWMFGNAAFLVGAGLLIGGASIELMHTYERIAGLTMFSAGGAITAGALWAMAKGSRTNRFVSGAVVLMAGAAHLFGLFFHLDQLELTGTPVAMAHLYAAAVMIIAGLVTNVRVITALAIVPFAQLLDTSTFYRYALYAFYSPEPTLTILQMTGLISICLWIATHWPERIARHARVLSVLAFVVASLCALVGSLWGDVIGQTVWGPGRRSWQSGLSNEDWRAAVNVFQAHAITISKEMYSILWAVALAALVVWSAHTNRRGLFNASLTFAGIHGYTQLMSFYDGAPLAFVISGLVAIPLAWGMWQANNWLKARDQLAAM